MNISVPKTLKIILAMTAFLASLLVAMVVIKPVRVVPIFEPNNNRIAGFKDIKSAANICSSRPIMAEED